MHIRNTDPGEKNSRDYRSAIIIIIIIIITIIIIIIVVVVVVVIVVVVNHLRHQVPNIIVTATLLLQGQATVSETPVKQS